MRVLLLKMLLLCTVLTGCYSMPVYETGDPLATHHIGSDIYGAYESYYRGDEALRYRPPWGKPNTQVATNREVFRAYGRHLDLIQQELLAKISAAPRDEASGRRVARLLIFLHGGLNHPSGSTARLRRFLSDAQADGYYPIFVSWRSGEYVSLADRYVHVRQGRSAEGPLAYARGGMYFLTDLLTGAAKFPETLWNGTANAVATHNGWLERDHDCYRKYEPEQLLWGGGTNFSWPRRGWIQVRKVVPGTARLVTTPLTQGFGTQSWNMMLRRAENLMQMEADVLDSNSSYCGACENQYGHGVLSLLAERLQGISEQAQAQGVTLEIMLVGHSMGGILANRVVQDYPDLPYTTIIHMASADSVRSFLDKTAPWLEAHPDAQFYNLVLHPSHEETEAPMQSFIPPGSLLVWLDDMFAAPNHVLDRREGRWDNAKYLLPLFHKRLRNAHLKVFPLNGDGLPRKHGDFGACQFWKRDFYWRDGGDLPTKSCDAE